MGLKMGPSSLLISNCGVYETSKRYEERKIVSDEIDWYYHILSHQPRMLGTIELSASYISTMSAHCRPYGLEKRRFRI